ncbi:hypothetical protein PUH89_07530 [Rhodobacter capsulatus]|uniref:Uncharacterized protein n=1 Tax=Rhodobacter capsulatus TaxID=1061 RepID=A0A1G7CYD7_RHOCA|nr:hypothetical protein [Rhodobacter capsulatus]WER10814.1 hypothetical protein PUH89_07530 [Rhodobacter capsulatus]SDE43780.1 hypothetical protein SAMN04244550_00405 [Rhodobacter capsulatus]
MNANTTSNSAERIKTVKAAWDKAPDGPKKEAALKHYQAAEKAQTAKDDAGRHQVARRRRGRAGLTRQVPPRCDVPGVAHVSP